MKLRIEPQPSSYTADKAVTMVDEESNLFILLGCEHASLVALEIATAVNCIDAYHDALQRIADWSNAYPETIFPEPDLLKARELLEAGGMSLDSVSAHAMRHAIKGVGKIANKVLKG